MSDRPLFDPRRFKDAARYYTAGRPAYPKALARRVAERVDLRGENVLDLGTGPGFLAIDFAPFASTVTAIDPSAEMLAAASGNVERAKVQIRLLQGSSYELGTHLGRFKLVTIGRAFHWMDRRATLEALDRMIPEGGAVVLFGERYPDVPANAWVAEFQSIIDGYRADDPAGPLIRGRASNEAVLLESAFDRLERWSVIEPRTTPLERFIDRALSYAATWQGRPGSREHDLAVDVQRALARHADENGCVSEVIEGQALIARRSKDAGD
jgi:SAM-dependent methyltransferase